MHAELYQYNERGQEGDSVLLTCRPWGVGSGGTPLMKGSFRRGFLGAGGLAVRGSLRVNRARAPMTTPGGPSQKSSCRQEASVNVSVSILKS